MSASRPVASSRSLVRLVVVLVMCALVAPASAQTDWSAPGPYEAGWFRDVIERPGGGRFDARIWYPATDAGLEAPLDPSGGPYAVIAFGHGYLQDPEMYESTLEHLATWGFLVVAPESALGLFPNHRRFADDLRSSMDHMTAENDDPESRFFGVVDPEAFGLSGHSMGGGCSLLAAADEGPRLRAVANLAAAETNPSAIAAMPDVVAPVSLISGDADRIVPVETNGQRMYDATPAPRILPVLRGANHCGFEDSWTFGCDGGGSMGRPRQLELTRRLLTAFFMLHLRDEQSAWSDAWGPGLLLESDIATRIDPGAEFLPRVVRTSAAGGAVVEIPLVLANTSDVEQTFDLAVSFGRWPARVEPAVVGPIPPGGEAGLVVIVDVPTEGSAPRDRIAVSARTGRDDATRAVAGLVVQREP